MPVGLALILVPLVFFLALLAVVVIVSGGRRLGRSRARFAAMRSRVDPGGDELTRRLGRTRARMNDMDLEVRRLIDAGTTVDRMLASGRHRLIRKRVALERTNRRALVPAARVTSMLSGTAGQRRTPTPRATPAAARLR